LNRMLELTQALARNLIRRNRSRIRGRLARNADEGPRMRPQEEDIVREVLLKLQPSKCLEWGAGMSTLQFPALVPVETRWLSVEHDRRWAEVVRRANPRPNVATALVTPDQPDWTGDGPSAAFRSYIAYPSRFGPYDFVLVDGRARAAAIEAVPNMLADGGVVILHDANRAEYVDACGAFPHQVLFQDSRARSQRPSGGVWVGSLTRPLHTILDVALHQRIWHFYSGIGRPLA
jgi:predicted O-methyltransferase YrrM